MFQAIGRPGGYANLRRFPTRFATFRQPTAQDLHAEMASIRKEKSGTWRVQVRRKGRSISETFIRYDDAKKWGVEAERQIDRGETPPCPGLASTRHW